MSQFKQFFTLEQVKQTLIANYNDKAKTIKDLQYKESIIIIKWNS